MNYSLYKLNFKTALHIGRSDGGISLDDGEMIIRSDTIFSALCCEAAKNNKVLNLYEYYKDKMLVNSDALPFLGEELFLPRPIMYLERENREYKQSENQKKELKKLEYIPLSHYDSYISDLNKSKISIEELKKSFGQMNVYNRVNIKDSKIPTPYHIATWRFRPNSGLFIILKYKDDRAKNLFRELLTNLGISGIGGKQTSGLGKFELSEHEIPIELLRHLNNKDARYHMLIGTGLPSDKDLDNILEEGWYKLIRRGGFIRTTSYSDRQLKKKAIYMFSAGSVFAQRFAGEILDLSHKGNHPIWRCANSLFLGVDL